MLEKEPRCSAGVGQKGADILIVEAWTAFCTVVVLRGLVETNVCGRFGVDWMEKERGTEVLGMSGPGCWDKSWDE